MKAIFAKYPAIVWALIGTLAALAVKFVPGLAGFDLGTVADFIAAVITATTGVVVHRVVTPVDPPERGL